MSQSPTSARSSVTLDPKISIKTKNSLAKNELAKKLSNHYNKNTRCTVKLETKKYLGRKFQKNHPRIVYSLRDTKKKEQT